MAAYLRNAPPAYECNHDRGALPPLSHFRPGVPSIPASRRDIQEGEGVDVSVQTRNQPAAVYPQSIKDDCQREYQQRQLSPWLDTQPPTSGSRHFASTRCEIYPTSCTHVRIIHSRRYRLQSRQARIVQSGWIFQVSSVGGGGLGTEFQRRSRERYRDCSRGKVS